MSRHVEMLFFKLSRKSRLSRLTFFWRQDRDRDLDRDLDKNREISIFRVVETVETWFLNCRENLDCRDVVFQTVKKISTVETDFFLASRSRSRRDKSRPPTLVLLHYLTKIILFK